MKTSLNKELRWLLGTTALSAIIALGFFGKKLFNGHPLELQIHDTYYLFPKYFLLSAIFIILLISVYLNRLSYWKSNNRRMNILLFILLIIFLLPLINYASWTYGFTKDSGYYFFNERTQAERISEFTMTLWILTIVIVATFMTIVVTGYKMTKTK